MFKTNILKIYLSIESKENISVFGGILQYKKYLKTLSTQLRSKKEEHPFEAMLNCLNALKSYRDILIVTDIPELTGIVSNNMSSPYVISMKEKIRDIELNNNILDIVFSNDNAKILECRSIAKEKIENIIRIEEKAEKEFVQSLIEKEIPYD